MVKNSLAQFKEDCLVASKRIGDHMDFETYPKNETLIANNYLHAKAMTEILRTYYSAITNYNELLAKYEADMDSYMAMLILRHWKDIGGLYEKCKTAGHGLAREDFASIVYERIGYAMKYQAWNREDSATNAQACINMAIATEKKNQFYFSNLDKNKANVNVTSLESTINGDSDDKETTLADTLADEKKHEVFSGADGIVKMYVDDDKLVEAVIIDNIANGDTLKTTAVNTTFTIQEKNRETGKYETVVCKGKEYYQEYKKYATAQVLRSLPENYEKIFAAKFHVAYDKICKAVSAIRSAAKSKNSNTLYKYLDKTLIDMQSKKELIRSLLS